MTVTLARFQALDEKCISILEAAETGQRELTKRSISEDIAASEEYVAAADEFMFETGRYIEINPMTHDDCHLWYMLLEDVLSSQGSLHRSHSLLH